MPREIPEEVDDPYAQDYREASLCLEISPKASAALSRRVLQAILRDKAGVKHGRLSDEIEELRSRNELPPDLASDLESVRHVGNFAAHPIKNQEAEAVTEVEPGEAEWLLDLLSELMEFYFVRPKVRGEKRSALNEKLKAAGKPPLPEAMESD